MLVEDSIQFFRARKSGYLFYTADSEMVSVENPPFLSNDPVEVEYGFLAKVSTEVCRGCDPDTGVVTDTVVQKLASQVMGDRSEGQLVLASAPKCGQTSDQDADKQVRFDYLSPSRHEGCERGVGFLVRVPVTVGNGRNEEVVSEWRLMEQMRMRASQLGYIERDTAEAQSSLLIVASLVDGGTTDDPCYRLKILRAQSRGLPTAPANGDTIYWSSADEQWKAVKRGLSFHPLSESENALVIPTRTSPGTSAVVLPDFPTDAPGDVWGRFNIRMGLVPGGTSTTWAMTAGNLLQCRCEATVENLTQNVEFTIKVTSTTNFAFSKAGPGACTAFLTLLGYEY